MRGEVLVDRALRDADVPADLHVPDAPLLDQPPREAGGGAEQLGDLVDGQMLLGHAGRLSFRSGSGGEGRGEPGLRRR